jgi:hypothetical protein
LASLRGDFAAVFPNRPIQGEFRDQPSSEIAPTAATIVRQVDDDSTKSVDIRPIIHLTPGALNLKKTGPRQDRQMRRHGILRNLATSGHVACPDRAGERSYKPAKGRHARILRERGQGLDGGTLIDASRHADKIAEQ